MRNNITGSPEEQPQPAEGARFKSGQGIARQASFSHPGVGELEEGIAEVLARQMALAPGVTLPVVRDALFAVHRVKVLDHQAIDSAKHDGMALSMQLVRTHVAARL